MHFAIALTPNMWIYVYTVGNLEKMSKTYFKKQGTQTSQIFTKIAKFLVKIKTCPFWRVMVYAGESNGLCWRE